ncbi:hypothetical protein [Rubellimicrobium arenae]|nr:hypothetical protein [Rubellimicrobium arenae]
MITYLIVCGFVIAAAEVWAPKGVLIVHLGIWYGVVAVLRLWLLALIL